MDTLRKGPLDEEGDDQQEQSPPQAEHSGSQGKVAFADELVEVFPSDTICDLRGGEQTTTDDDEKNDSVISDMEAGGGSEHRVMTLKNRRLSMVPDMATGAQARRSQRTW